jgi:hypothetical protein
MNLPSQHESIPILSISCLSAVRVRRAFIKGPAYRAQFGMMANIRDGLFIALCLLAIKISNRRFHAVVGCFTVLFEIFCTFKSSLTAPG